MTRVARAARSRGASKWPATRCSTSSGAAETPQPPPKEDGGPVPEAIDRSFESDGYKYRLTMRVTELVQRHIDRRYPADAADGWLRKVQVALEAVWRADSTQQQLTRHRYLLGDSPSPTEFRNARDLLYQDRRRGRTFLRTQLAQVVASGTLDGVDAAEYAEINGIPWP